MTMSDQKPSSVNSFEYIDKKTQSLVNFGEFNGICNKVIQKNYKKEKYAKLVSVPSMYRKCCEQVLLGVYMTSQNKPVDKKALLAKLEKFVDREFKIQISSYRLQFNDFRHIDKKKDQKDKGDKSRGDSASAEDASLKIGLHLRANNQPSPSRPDDYESNNEGQLKLKTKETFGQRESLLATEQKSEYNSIE